MKRLSLVPPLLCLALVMAAEPLKNARAQEREPEVMLPTCGIRYPGGYDPNTVGVVEGRIASLVQPQHGPVSFRLEASGEAFTVFAAPAWYWEERGVAIAIGDQVRVKGSKSMGADGNLYLVAREITGPGIEKPFVLRDARGKPAWSGCGPRGCKQHGRQAPRKSE